MTRNEAREYNAENYPASVLQWMNKITDNIYDDFESRICANCKFSEKTDDDTFRKCIKTDSMMKNKYTYLHDVCNKWEKI